MNFIENIKSTIKEYKQYKTHKRSNSLMLPNTKMRNIFKYVQIKNLERKYGEALFKHFDIKDDVDSYDILINLFGKKNIERALENPATTTTQIADKLFEFCNRDFYDEAQNNFVLKNMMDCITFNKATGFNLPEFDNFYPKTFCRKSLNNKNMLNIFKENEITKDILKEIYEIYSKEIITCYNNDSYLRNKTVLMLDDKYANSLASGGLQDHVTSYSEDDFNLIFQKYFNNEELSKTDQHIVLGLLVKEADLIGTYTVKHLKKHPEYIKSEINVGIFDDIILSGKKYTNDERKKLATLSSVWHKDDLSRYNNLNLLKNRVSSLPKNPNLLKTIDTIEELLSKPLNEIIANSKEISEFMRSAFMDYEIENRNQIVEKLYNPKDAQEIVISDITQINSPAMLHFFNPNKIMLNFDEYIKNLEEKRSKELQKNFKFSEDEKKVMFLQYKLKNNHYVTDYTLDSELVGQIGTYDNRYVTNISNQLSTMVSTPQELLDNNGIRGNLALGFSKETLSPELIATISSKNIYSNKGIDYVESNNPFEDFSVSSDELISAKKYKDNNEIVLFRNSYEASLKPSYIMYIGNDKLDSKIEKENIELIKKEMKYIGLNIPLVIFDRYSIREKMQNNKLEQSQDCDIQER